MIGLGVCLTVAILLFLAFDVIAREVEFQKSIPAYSPQREQNKEMLDKEIGNFLAQVGDRLPHQWTDGESCWYESIRSRESQL